MLVYSNPGVPFGISFLVTRGSGISFLESVKEGLLKSFANFTGKQLCWSLFLIKLTKFEDNISPACAKSEITPKSYGIGPDVKFQPYLSSRGEIPSLIEHILSSHVFL